ncbi:hypothetical protein BDR22DRAFT_971103 [Usnea florida]
MVEVAPPYKDLRKLLVLATRVFGFLAAPISWHILLHYRRPVAAGTQSSIMIVAWFLILAATSRASILQGHSQEEIAQPNGLGVAPSGSIADPARIADQIPRHAHGALARRVVPKAQCGAPIPSQLIDSCREAFDFLPDTGPVDISFGQRALKGQVDHVVPFLVMSSDGHCAISINITQPSVQRDEETVDRVVEALNEIFESCILGGVAQGGIVIGLGTTQALSIAIDKPEITGQTQVSCFSRPSGSPPTEESCMNALDLVPYDFTPQVFGLKGNPRATVGLPQVWRDPQSPGTGCGVALLSPNGVLFETTWAQIWTLAVIVNAVCVRQGKNGAMKFAQGQAFIGLGSETRTLDVAK